ncbi:histidine kinase [Paracidovorax avenae]|uniref:cache domain-containing protein n=1 Tax=Paracidovorax avenae TaxID=80867 RepID=UPI000D15D117|nr:cache domain-containing protein [Paracidovorax avenae]AVS69769.1 histidine kinase [Paracidovorax avenae]AVS77170.1 histidine kinase [Paracidovorax avenae]
MQLRLKLLLLSTLPILVALGSVAATARHQTLRLAQQERELVETAYLHSKETELRHYVQLAQSALARIAAEEADPAERQRQALALLSRMQFGRDGYFFVYDREGNVLLDARHMGLSGVDLCDPGDPRSEAPANRILATARQGGGMVRYDWQKPSSQLMAPKLAYVTTLPGWEWILGTGLYLDDVQETLRHIDRAAQENIDGTRQRIYGIAALCIVLIGLAGLALNLSDHRVASAKLRRLAQRVVSSQEEERVRVARELHDGVVQVLVSSKFLLETAQVQWAARAAHAPRDMLDHGLERLNDALLEIRRVSHGLRPALLDDLGLAPALALMAQEVEEQGAFSVRFVLRGPAGPLPTSHGTALFRIAQEALTNARMHACATHVEVALRFTRWRVSLSVRDDGRGFDVQRVQRDGQGGIGLRNMRERIEGLGGRFAIASGRGGTRILAVLDRRDATAAGLAAGIEPYQVPA